MLTQYSAQIGEGSGYGAVVYGVKTDLSSVGHTSKMLFFYCHDNLPDLLMCDVALLRQKLCAEHSPRAPLTVLWDRPTNFQS